MLKMCWKELFLPFGCNIPMRVAEGYISIYFPLPFVQGKIRQDGANNQFCLAKVRSAHLDQVRARHSALSGQMATNRFNATWFVKVNPGEGPLPRLHRRCLGELANAQKQSPAQTQESNSAPSSSKFSQYRNSNRINRFTRESRTIIANSIIPMSTDHLGMDKGKSDETNKFGRETS